MEKAATPRLTEEQLKLAYELIELTRKEIQRLAKGDPDLVFAYRRKVAKELTYDERGKPHKRTKLKKTMFKLQEGKCAEGGEPLELKGSILDRKVATLGYTRENVELICHACDQKRQWGPSAAAPA